jgi:hypothetical protein
MNETEFKKARADLLSAMTRLLIETDSEEQVKRIFTDLLPEASSAYVAELNRVIRERREPPVSMDEKTTPLWSICSKYKPQISSSLWHRCMGGTEDDARQFLVQHIKEFPEPMQDELIVVFVEEALATKLEADRGKLEQLHKIRPLGQPLNR